MNRANIKIKPDEWYTLNDLVVMCVFPWISSFKSVRRIVVRDREEKNLLKANIIGTGRGKKYHFKGENIINFIKNMDGGNVRP
jgi:hypothetical protein